MNLKNVIDSVVTHVAYSRKIDLTAQDKSTIETRLEKFIIDGDYSFSIPTVGVYYCDGKNTDYPRLYGDAVLAYAVSIMMEIKESKQRKSQMC